jgi:hypothetical protein
MGNDLFIAHFLCKKYLIIIFTLNFKKENNVGFKG